MYKLWYNGSRDGTHTKIGLAETILPNQSPEAICQDVTIPANESCEAEVTPEQVDNGSYDPDGDPITFVLEPHGPYHLGVTEDEKDTVKEHFSSRVVSYSAVGEYINSIRKYH